MSGDNSRSAATPGSISWKYIAIYYAIACGIAWTIWAPLVLGQNGLRLLSISPSVPVMICLGTIGPLIACYAMHRLQTGNWRAVRLLPRDAYRLPWLFLAPLLVLFCFFVVFPALISKGGPKAWHWHPAVLGRIFVPMFNYNLFGGPLFEEFGWRGFLQMRLQRAAPPWLAAICVGILWSVWHWPLFLVTGWSSAPPQVFLLILVGVSLVMAFGYNASGKAVVAAILMHSAFNSSPRLLDGYLKGVATREHPSAEVLIAASFLIVGVALALVTRGRLGAGNTEGVEVS